MRDFMFVAVSIIAVPVLGNRAIECSVERVGLTAMYLIDRSTTVGGVSIWVVTSAQRTET